jgi:hypothetical protein
MLKKLAVFGLSVGLLLAGGLPTASAAVVCAPDDAFEENDDAATATPITDGTPVSAISCNVEDEIERDYYSLPITEGRRVVMTVTFLNSEGDIDIAADDPNDDRIDASFGLDDTEQLTFIAPATGVHFFEVFKVFETGSSNYTLTVTTSELTCTINGTTGNDKLKGTAGDDVICGGEGNDKIDGKKGNDVILGGGGNDKLEGGKGIDDVLGQAGDDKVIGNNDDDRLSGGDGVDKVNGGGGDDYCLDTENPEDKQKNCAAGPSS